MKSIKLLTSRYPYGIGEQFLEEEMIYWEKDLKDFNLEILPFLKEGKLRFLPRGVKVNSFYSFKINYLFFFRLITFKFFWMEITYLIKSKKFTISNLLKLLKYGVLIVQSYYQLKKINTKTDIFYCYWSNFSSYGALLLKMIDGLDVKVTTRMHRFDLYEHLYNKNYMPFKRQFIHNYDNIFVLSQEGVNYLRENFCVDSNKIISMPLGVNVKSRTMDFKKDNEYVKIVSISNCIKVKRIDKIIDALKNVEKKSSKKIIWHHYGDGILKNKLIDHAFSQLKNVEFEFKGNISNQILQNELLNEGYHLIINASESEGIPVSLMEAMAKEIIPIAPNIGGIKFLINEENGYLLSENCTVDEMYISIMNYLSLSEEKKEVLRSNAYNMIITNYNSARNYNNFIEYFMS